jgi:hypothetical protein
MFELLSRYFARISKDQKTSVARFKLWWFSVDVFCMNVGILHLRRVGAMAANRLVSRFCVGSHSAHSAPFRQETALPGAPRATLPDR